MIRLRTPRTSFRRRRPLGSLLSLCAAGLVVLAVGAAPASASTTTLSQATTLSGSQTLSSTGITATGLGVTATFDLTTTLNWNQVASLGTAFDPNLVRQGRSLDPSDSYTRTGSGSMALSWTLSNLMVSWDGVGPLSLGSPGLSATGSCDLEAAGPNEVCHLSSSQLTLLDSCAIYPLPCAGPYVKLGLVADLTITPQEIATMRQATFGGNPDGTNSLSLVETPLTDPLFIPCTVGAGDELVYSLGSLSTTQAITVVTSLQFDVGAVGSPGFPVSPVFVSFAKPTIPLDSTLSSIAMSGAGASFDMGAVQHNNIPPTVNAGGPYSGNEGSPISFDGSGSSSICGFPTLRWDLSDGGVAFGEFPQHIFADDGLYSGQLTATDVTGLSSTTTFAATVFNVAPSVTAGPNKTSLWGVPVAFHANGSDPGPIDNANLLYSWDFGDPNAPVGAVGQDASHTYSQPGTYTAQVTVTDLDGATATSQVQVTVLKRATTIAYTGPLKSLPSKNITLAASLVDELGQPVVGRTVAFALGSQTASAATNSSGVASVTIKLNQKQGTYPVSAGFAGDGKYVASLNSQTFTIGP
jgi:PKD repeat protein